MTVGIGYSGSVPLGVVILFSSYTTLVTLAGLTISSKDTSSFFEPSSVLTVVYPSSVNVPPALFL